VQESLEGFRRTAASIGTLHLLLPLVRDPAHAPDASFRAGKEHHNWGWFLLRHRVAECEQGQKKPCENPRRITWRFSKKLLIHQIYESIGQAIRDV
jgi:hypothetical protein